MILKLFQYFQAIGYSKFRKIFSLCGITVMISLLELMNVGLIFPILQSFVDPQGFNNNLLTRRLMTLTGVVNLSRVTFIIIAFFLFITVFRTIITYKGYKKIIRQLSGDEAIFAVKQYEKLLSKDYLFFQSTPSAKIIRDIAIAIPLGYSTAMQSIIIILSEGVLLLGLGVYLLVLSPLIFVSVSMTFSMTALIYIKLISPKIAMLGRERHEISHKTIEIIQQSLEGISQIKNWQCEKYFRKLFEKQREKQASITAFLNVMQNFPKMYFETILMFCICGFLLYAIFITGNSKAILSVTGFYIIAAMRILPSVLRLSAQYNNLISVQPAIEVILRENGLHSELVITPKMHEFSPPFESCLSFEDITFKYEQEIIIKNLFFEIKKGDFIGIFGRSGQGKTTLVNLLVGLLEPEFGTIKIDGKIHQISDTHDLLSLIGYVPQNIFLTDDTISRNVAFGEEDHMIDDKRVLWALEKAQLLDFIESLDSGIHTMVGERGSRISGGQRQRIGIARALYFDRKIVFFDEATSSLDEETERKLCETIRSFKGEKTVLLVSHRPVPLSICDKIFEMKSGKLVEKSHE